MRGSFASAARWNAHYAREAERARDEAIRVLRTLTDVIQEAFSPAEADEEGFWSVWYDWQRSVHAVRVPYDNAYHYGHGGGATSAIFAEFKRIVRRRGIEHSPYYGPEATPRDSLANAEARTAAKRDHGPAPEQGELLPKR